MSLKGIKMYKNLKDKLREKLKLYSFDNYEKELINNPIEISLNNSEKVIFFECPLDHFFLHLYSEVIKKEGLNNNYIGKIEIPLRLNIFHLIFIFPFIVKKISQIILIRKWKKLYSSIGIKTFSNTSPFSIKSLIKALQIFSKIRTEEELKKLKIDKILVGDLIIDSTIRFREAKLPTVNVTSLNIIIYYYRVIQYLEFYSKLTKQYKIDKAFIAQSVFIFHGVPLRKLYEENIQVFCSASLDNCLFKKIRKSNDTGIPDSSTYKKTFSEKYTDKHIKIGIEKFSSRFEGVDDIGWLESFGTHPYNISNKKSGFEFDGILFLHDFYDGPHFYGETLFLDFFDWTVFTLDFIVKNKLNVGVKLHPFQSFRSKMVCNYLMKKYESIHWLEDVSNKSLFDSGIKYGITQHGTVISELAYHKIKPIYCGDHPIDSFNIGFKATTIKEYERHILNHDNLSFTNTLNDEIGKFYFMHNIHDKSDYHLENSDGIKLKQIKDRFQYEKSDLTYIYNK
jgi:hypothetical protein